MPIFFYSDPEQVTVEFTGGDLIVGLCGDEDGSVDSVGIAEAVRPGESGQDAEETDASAPSVYLRFHTAASLDSFIRVLKDYREERFGG